MTNVSGGAMPGATTTRRAAVCIAALAFGPAVLAGCGGSSSGGGPAAAVSVAFDPMNFDKPATGRNRYLPLVSGTQSVRTGTTLVGGRAVPHQVTTTITDVHREIAGVDTVLMLDHELDGGQVAQESIDYAAEDKQGNVWLLGGYTEEYEGA